MSVLTGIDSLRPVPPQSTSNGTTTNSNGQQQTNATSGSATTASSSETTSSGNTGSASAPPSTGSAPAQSNSEASPAAPPLPAAGIAKAAKLAPTPEISAVSKNTDDETTLQNNEAEELARVRAAADAYRSQRMIDNILEGMSGVYDQVNVDNPDEIAVPWIDNLPDKP